MFHLKNFEKISDIIAKSYDGALISPGSNLFYLTGLDPKSVLERLYIYLIYPDKESVLIAPKLYEDEIDVCWIDKKYIWDDDDNPYEILRKCIKKLKKENGKLLIEDNMKASKLIEVQNFLKEFELVPLSKETTHLRLKKDDLELKYMQKAANIVDKVFDELIERELEGKSEREVASLIDFLMKKNGADGPAFNTIVASGKNAANPHHSPTDKVLKRGEMVIMDYGAKYEGYCSDITRTVAVKDCSEDAKQAYNVVKKAEEVAFKAVKKNKMAKVIDETARDIIEDAGFGQYFTHRVGHGLGLDPHEEPYLTGNNEEKLKNGMTLTIEPGIYIKDKFGIRIEDDVVVKNKGKRLTKTKRNLKFV